MYLSFYHSTMSSKTDVIYSHKKFKKVTLEACERKETEVKLVTTTCKQVEDDGRPVDAINELCSCNGSNSCYKCLQNFRSKGDYLRHKLLLSKHAHRELPPQTNKGNAMFCRSISLPLVDPDVKILPESKLCETESKPIYKPKFRAQYSIDNKSKSSQEMSYPSLYSLVSRANTYHESSVSTNTISDHFGQISIRKVTDDAQKVKCDTTSRPTCSQGLWKGIKSPSPELVGQHITNLIVQNKAIVETQNPIWPIKYKRQCSLGLTTVGESLSKVKRTYSDMKCRNYGRSKSPHYIPHNIGIDQKSQQDLSSHQTITTATCPVTISRKVSYDDLQSTCFVDDSGYIKLDTGVLTQSPHTSNVRHQSKPDVALSRQLSISLTESDKIEACHQCGMVVESNNMSHHLQYSCKRSFLLELPATGDKLQQVEALDLQMNKCLNINRPTSFEHKVIHQNMCDKKTFDESEQEFITHPYKNCSLPSSRLNMKQPNLEFVNVPSKVSISNGNVFHNEYRTRVIDELHKPKSSSHHIYGGEVKICDGTAFKTLKIDSIKKEKPSLDLCLASQQLGGKEASIEIRSPTSHVVKFAKYGLNSGGTMVKVDSHKPRCATLTSEVNNPSNYYAASEQNNFAYKNTVKHSNSLINNSALTLIRLSSPKGVLSHSGNSKERTNSPFNTVNNSVTGEKELTYHHPYSNKLRKDKYPVVMSIGVENIPHVPGMPGPYSQPNGVIPIRWSTDLASLPAENSSNYLTPESKSGLSVRKLRTDPFVHVYSDKTKRGCQSPSKDEESKLGCSESSSLEIEFPTSDIARSVDSSTNEKSCFLVPRKRPSTLTIKPTQLNSKSSLIGSTLVSPDTPRPKKSCAQLLLNGSAYTYLNMKVSTKTFFCCIYRPQPMYVLQATNPKLSMYSNWQVRKTEEPFNLSPAKLMSLHQSGVYYDRSYTIAKSSQMIVTGSSPELTKYKVVPKRHQSDSSLEIVAPHTFEGETTKRKSEDEAVEDESAKRVKIFEGGFKTNEDYTYVRGRGRGRYVCETCGIRCKKPSMLKKHIRTHTDLRPFACGHCSFSFKTKGNLTKHLKSKAHYKRCTEMGIKPVPTAVDDTHINKEALELQGKINLTINSGQSADDDDDSDDDNEESDDDEFDDFEEEEKGQDGAQNLSEDVEDEGPIDLSVKRDAHESKRPSTLVLPAVSARVTPSTVSVILENASEILSPVTDSSCLLKSIYDTTLKASKATERAVTQEPGCGAPMLQQYLREIAVLDTARKRKYIKVTECQEILSKRVRTHDCINTSSGIIPTVSCPTSMRHSLAGDIAAAIVVSCETSNQSVDGKRTTSSGPFTATTIVLPMRKRDSSPIAYRNSPCHITDGASHVMPSVPANMVVVNTSGTDSKAAFMSPSGVIPTSSNRPGCDDDKSKCSICQKEFSKQSQLSLHMNIHYIERPHRCDSCGVSFRTNGHLQKHMRSVSHYNKLNMNMTFGTPSTENPRPFKCHDCKSAFRIHGHLAKHLRSKLHIMRLECLGKLPFGTYAEIERSGISLNEIDTSDCDNSLDSLQEMALKMYETDPTRLSEWTKESKSARVRTISNSSNNSDEYSLDDELKQTEDESESGFDDDLTEFSLEPDVIEDKNKESCTNSSSVVPSEA